jgi:phage terminase large subunit
MNATAKIRQWRNDPVLFVREVFEAEPDTWQLDVLAEMGRPGRKRIAMKACAGPGKTAVLAWAGWHRLACFAARGEHPKGAAVSVTRDNLDANLWPEMAKWQGRSRFLQAAFTWTKTRIFANDHPETWFLDARGYPKTANPEEIGRTLSGLHSQFPFYLIDESGDIAPSMVRSAEQGLTSCEDGLIITAGNTTSHSGLLYHASTQGRGQWFVVSITADPDNPKRTSRVDPTWAREQIDLYGRDNPWVMAYILGEFPPGSINALLSVEEVEAAMGRHLREDAYSWSQKRLGVDVARFGDDRTVIFPRQGLAAGRPIILRHQRTTDIAARVAQEIVGWGAEMQFVDDTGHWGHGVIDGLFAAGYSPVGIQFHGPALDPRYKNRRAEMWFALAEWVKGGGSLPPIPEMVAELTGPTYTFSGGKLLLEDKDQIKKRIGRSPDLGDALALTFAIPDQPGQMGIPGMRRQALTFANTEYELYGGD